MSKFSGIVSKLKSEIVVPNSNTEPILIKSEPIVSPVEFEPHEFKSSKSLDDKVQRLKAISGKLEKPSDPDKQSVVELW